MICEAWVYVFCLYPVFFVLFQIQISLIEGYKDTCFKTAGKDISTYLYFLNSSRYFCG
jgi:hypothetical protein